MSVTFTNARNAEAVEALQRQLLEYLAVSERTNTRGKELDEGINDVVIPKLRKLLESEEKYGGKFDLSFATGAKNQPVMKIGNITFCNALALEDRPDIVDTLPLPDVEGKDLQDVFNATEQIINDFGSMDTVTFAKKYEEKKVYNGVKEYADALVKTLDYENYSECSAGAYGTSGFLDIEDLPTARQLCDFLNMNSDKHYECSMGWEKNHIDGSMYQTPVFKVDGKPIKHIRNCVGFMRKDKRDYLKCDMFDIQITMPDNTYTREKILTQLDTFDELAQRFTDEYLYKKCEELCKEGSLSEKDLEGWK